MDPKFLQHVGFNFLICSANFAAHFPKQTNGRVYCTYKEKCKWVGQL